MQRSALCRSRRELSNEYLVANFGFDTAENEPLKVWAPVVSTRHFFPPVDPAALPGMGQPAHAPGHAREVTELVGHLQIQTFCKTSERTAQVPAPQATGDRAERSEWVLDCVYSDSKLERIF